MDYSKYIFPINGAFEGTGVLVGSLFITAGHVVKGFNRPYVFISSKKYYLSQENNLFLDDNTCKSSMCYDLAVFRLDGVISPLLLADYIPNKCDELVSLSHHTTCERKEGVGVFQNTIESQLEIMAGKVIEIHDYYFECLMNGTLREGRSGSPLMNGNKVVGILIGDTDGKEVSNTVLYLSSKAIYNLLKEKGYGK